MEGKKTMNGKVVLITGAGKGEGRQVAKLFAEAGALIAAADLTPINLEETVSQITASGGVVKPFLVDIARKLPVQGLLNQVMDEFQHLDILINGAEVEPHRSLMEMDEWDWARTLDVNLTGAFLLTQSAGRIMREKGGGIIIHISEPSPVKDGNAAYLASKAGLEKMICSAAKEFLAWNIKIHLATSAEEALDLC